METILIAEDSATQRQMLQHTLEQFGYRVVATANGREALHVAAKSVPDLIITDIIMPEMDGYQLCRELKSDARTREIPVILLTALSDPKDVVTALQCGADNFIGKPFADEDLQARVRYVFSNRALGERETRDGSVQVIHDGQTYRVNAGRAQIVDLLLSVYDAAMRRNEELILAQGKLTKLNEQLQQKFKDREEILASERAARSEAERANRMKEDFLATVSHELRTPLSAILGWAQVMRETSPTGEELIEGLDTIERNARAQNQIIEDLLDMSRIVAGKMRLEIKPLDLVDAIRAGIETVLPAAEAKGVKVATELGTQTAFITGDSHRLQQVVWNLVSNAVKFTPEKGEVRVTLKPGADNVEIRVTDNGVGIGPDFLPYVFDRFRQSDSSITRRHGGLGLGLAIVKQLVELHGGSVKAESAGKDRGTAFTVTLPVQASASAGKGDDAAAKESADPTTLAPDVRLAQMRVLVVDDEADSRTLVKRLLQDRGAVVEVASSAETALQRLKSARFDVLVSDIGMPGEDGYTLISKIRALPPAKGGAIPAIALTAYASPSDRAKALQTGFQSHLVKPIETAQLIAKVAQLGAAAPRKK